jgi:hypothetical protein
MDFNWPHNEVWEGYINPYRSIRCDSCNQTGLSPKAKALQDKWWGLDLPLKRRVEAWQYNLTQEEVNFLVDQGGLWDYTRVPVTEAQKDPSMQHPNGWLKEWNGVYPDAAKVNEDTLKHHGLMRGVGSGECYTLIKRLAAKEGWDHLCEFCKGDGYVWESEEVRKQHEAWKETEPPAGEGFQLWETTSEGSPQSPVFPSLEKLCEWCEKHATTFSAFRASKEQWMKMLDEDFVHHTENGITFI